MPGWEGDEGENGNSPSAGRGNPRVNQGGGVPGAGRILKAGIAASRQATKTIVDQVKQLPRNLTIPDGAPSVRFMGVAYTNPTGGLGTTLYTLGSILAPPGQTYIFYKYRLWVSSIGVLDQPAAGGPVLPSYEFVPSIDGGRILTNHGIYNGSYFQLSPFMPTIDRKTILLNVGGGFDTGCVDEWHPCQVKLTPNRTMLWQATGGLTINRYMGVEMIGYADVSNETAQMTQLG